MAGEVAITRVVGLPTRTGRTTSTAEVTISSPGQAGTLACHPWRTVAASSPPPSPPPLSLLASALPAVTLTCAGETGHVVNA